ncbi:MAG: hypothetical protein GY772_24180, partial [bacterium]|nr:hypothetical protein [bacterium]
MNFANAIGVYVSIKGRYRGRGAEKSGRRPTLTLKGASWRDVLQYMVSSLRYQGVSFQGIGLPTWYTEAEDEPAAATASSSSVTVSAAAPPPPPPPPPLPETNESKVDILLGEGTAALVDWACPVQEQERPLVEVPPAEAMEVDEPRSEERRVEEAVPVPVDIEPSREETFLKCWHEMARTTADQLHDEARELVAHAWARVTGAAVGDCVPPDPGEHVALASSCFRRAWQVKFALPVNVLTLWPFRAFTRLYLVLIGKDEAECKELIPWLEEHFSLAVEEGVLRVGICSGVDTWHASIAKNSAARFVKAHTPASADATFLVNLDCDNCVGLQFVPDCLARLQRMKRTGQRQIVQWRGKDAGVTGRIGCQLSLFASISGYNEAFLPSGYQDIDMRVRAAKQGGFAAVYPREERLGGRSVPNDAIVGTHTHRARNSAKIANVGTEFAGMS